MINVFFLFQSWEVLRRRLYQSPPLVGNIIRTKPRRKKHTLTNENIIEELFHLSILVCWCIFVRNKTQKRSQDENIPFLNPSSPRLVNAENFENKTLFSSSNFILSPFFHSPSFCPFYFFLI